MKSYFFSWSILCNVCLRLFWWDDVSADLSTFFSCRFRLEFQADTDDADLPRDPQLHSQVYKSSLHPCKRFPQALKERMTEDSLTVHYWVPCVNVAVQYGKILEIPLYTFIYRSNLVHKAIVVHSAGYSAAFVLLMYTVCTNCYRTVNAAMNIPLTFACRWTV